MSRVLPFVLGPELYWVVICIATRVIGRGFHGPDKKYSGFVDGLWGWLPFVLVPLTFVFFSFVGGSRWWLLLRVDLSIGVGLVVAASIFANALMYHDSSSGPGAGTAFMVIPMLGYFMAFVATVITAIVLWVRSRGAA